MKLNDYIRGERHGRGAHEIELDAMRDPLLGEALEGFDSVPGDHSAALESLSERVRASATGGRAAARARASRRRESRTRGWSVAAATIFLVGAVGGSVWLLHDGLTPNASRTTASRTSTGYYSGQEEFIMPPVTVIPDETAPANSPTDMSDITLDSDEVRDFSDIATPEPARDTVVTAPFRRFVESALRAEGWTGRAKVSFEVTAEGRPQGIEVVESSSPDAARTIRNMLTEGPDWPTEPSRKLITINL